jgi:lipoprotein-anchoring transpeptidase ErfK/SrfK
MILRLNASMSNVDLSDRNDAGRGTFWLSTSCLYTSRLCRSVGMSRLAVAILGTALAVPAGSALAQYSPPQDPRLNTPPPGYVMEDQRGAVPHSYEVRSVPADGTYAAPVEISPGYPPAESRRVGIQPDWAPRPPSGVAQDHYSGQVPGAASGAAPVPSPAAVAALPPEDQPEIGEPKELPPQFQRQLVDYTTKEPAGTIVIDTANTFLYLVLGDGKALRYGIGVGREGFTWTGAERVSRMAQWPDWHPPAEMIERQPYLPRFMAGGDGNPMGARALYLGKTLYRIHGTNQPSTIGTFVSSGCIRLTNRDVEDLYNRVQVGTRVVVLPGKPPVTASTAPADAAAQLQGASAQSGPSQGMAPGSMQPGPGPGGGPISVAGPGSIPASALPPAR